MTREKYSKTSHFLEESPLEERLIALFDKSFPKFASRLVFEKIIPDFDYGEFEIWFKHYNHIAKIHFYDPKNLNDFWRFLETLTTTEKPLVMHFFHCGRELILYCAQKDKNDIRFLIAKSDELYKKQRESKIFRYSYEDFDIELDIYIRKKQFIKQFYTTLKEIFKEYESVAYFEPPAFDFDYWVKDSTIIERYIKGKKFKDVPV